MARYRHGWSKGWRKSVRGPSGEWFDSSWELQYMDELDRDPMVTRWTRHHDLQIPYRKWWGGLGRYEPDFLVELTGGEKEIREVKGEHLFKDKNTARKLAAGDAFCQQRGMKFRVVTRSLVNPEMWTPQAPVKIEAPSPVSPPPSRKSQPTGCLGSVVPVSLFVVVILAALVMMQ